MKLLLILTLFNIYAFQSEVYYVTFVRGEVKLQNTARILKTGDRINGNEKLILKDANSKISFISPSKGRFDISPGTVRPNSKGELLAMISEKMVPSVSRQRLSTRSINDGNGYDPISYFTSPNNQKILLIGDLGLPIAATFKLDQQSFFFLQYDHLGKVLVRKIPHENQSLFFSEKLFTDNHGAQINPEDLENVKLCYQTIENSVARSKMLVNFSPILANKMDLENEINTLHAQLKRFKNSNTQEINEEIFAHLSENYGMINSEQIRKHFIDKTQ